MQTTVHQNCLIVCCCLDRIQSRRCWWLITDTSERIVRVTIILCDQRCGHHARMILVLLGGGIVNIDVFFLLLLLFLLVLLLVVVLLARLVFLVLVLVLVHLCRVCVHMLVHFDVHLCSVIDRLRREDLEATRRQIRMLGEAACHTQVAVLEIEVLECGQLEEMVEIVALSLQRRTVREIQVLERSERAQGRQCVGGEPRHRAHCERAQTMLCGQCHRERGIAERHTTAQVELGELE
mmetsp:Transcript_28660/g.72066  ORF Transcript_28660/g.72066 Transcript_28660/m.72066 type:complete len:237 (-) Transcript_28660:1676-2386(-)